MIAVIPREEIRQTRALQGWLAAGRQEGAASVTVRLLKSRCGPLNQETGNPDRCPLPLARLEALMAFQGPA